MSQYESITKRVIEAIQTRKRLPWRRPWSGAALPSNLHSKREYRGINFLLLSMLDFESPWFLTFKQAQELGGHVKKGEHGVPIIFWSLVERKDKEAVEPKKFPILRTSTVFNISQCEGIAAPQAEAPSESISPIVRCEEILQKYPNPPQVIEKAAYASYSVIEDIIRIPRREKFVSAEEFYSTLFHEVVHSSGHSSRLNRKFISAQSITTSSDYAREELIAEFGASFLSAKAGIDSSTFENSVAYLQDWVTVFSEHPKLLVEAAGAAQRACDYILGVNQNDSEVKETKDIEC